MHRPGHLPHHSSDLEPEPRRRAGLLADACPETQTSTTRPRYPVQVPRLTGLTPTTAQERALDAGLKPVLMSPPTRRGPMVTAQRPGPGRPCRYGDRIRIWAVPGDVDEAPTTDN